MNYQIINNKHLKLPYIYTSTEILPCVKNLIVNLCANQDINYLTIYNSELNKLISKQHFFRITSKKFTQNYFASNKLFQNNPVIKKAKSIQSGDGDVVFT